MVDRLGGVLAEGEGAVVSADHCRHVDRVQLSLCEGLDDHVSGVGLIILFDLLRGQASGAGDGTVEIVCVGGAVGGDVASGLGPCHCVGAVGVDDAADLRPCVVEHQMGLRVGGGIHVAFHLLALKVHDHQVFRLQLVIFHTGGFDDEKTLFSVDAADISPGVGDQVALRQFHVGDVYLLFQFFKHLLPPLCVIHRDRQIVHTKLRRCMYTFPAPDCDITL